MKLEKQQMADPEKWYSKDRLVALSDGIFAIAITLLVIDIRLPEGLDPRNHALITEKFFELFPQFLSYIVSFLVIANYWMAHRRLMANVEHINDRLTKAHLILLFIIALIPVSTNFFGTYYGVPILTVFYTLNLAFCGIASVFILFYTRFHRNLAPEDPTILRHMDHRLRSALVPPVVFVASLLFLFFPDGAYYLPFSWMLIPVFAYLVHLPWTPRKPRPATKPQAKK
ncbi:putative membrane protein [Thermosporothrix hazakensis]|jgi:uncharacterized membrane protein|uniref:DUF1211 domain-containing membrane protein n=2 Tax=Thermosporothrix TaxID=768650 RepID=A0A455SLP5_9CHLR|nr:TMEM175 family protein [Thermosporothrix hazakensis]PZW24057.1 putative membrane protein [Thermosporothrix hazakensis]BBH87842.1 hypothetical protein KTC_25930 [Thermosporothrix sp. COM3]GCE50270.1 hypothetical protein KTH_51390 [Thermosporothrix hazakensis]